MIYFIQEEASGAIKIGYSGNPDRRLSILQTGHVGKLGLLAVMGGTVDDEQALHGRFSSCHLRGEWFHPSPDLTDFISALPKPEKAKSKTQEFWNGLTAAEVCRRTGFSSRMLCEIQAGKYRPSPEKAIAIQRATGVSAIKLVFGDLAEEAA